MSSSFELKECIFGRCSSEYNKSCKITLSFSFFFVGFLGLSLSHLEGLDVKTFFHGQEAGSLQKKAPRPHLKCMLHPFQSPAGRSGCFVPLCLCWPSAAEPPLALLELVLDPPRPPLPRPPPRKPRPPLPPPLETAATSAVA